MSFNNINRNDKKWKPSQADVINNILNRLTENIGKLEVVDLDRKSKTSEISIDGALSNSSIKIDNVITLRFSFDDETKINIPSTKGCIFDVYLKAYNQSGQYEVYRLNQGLLKKVSDYKTKGPYWIKVDVIV